MNLNLQFTAPEALELVRYHNPHMWPLDLLDPVGDLITFRKLHRLSHKGALVAMTMIKTNMAKNIYLMAAYAYIMEENVKIYHDTVEKIHMYTTQLGHLDRGSEPDEKKQELRAFYRDRLSELEEKKKNLLNIKDVRMALEVESVTLDPKHHEKT